MGGSNDLQSPPNFFSELFMIFVHKIKKPNKILKKVGNMVHPSGDYWKDSNKPVLRKGNKVPGLCNHRDET